MAGWSEYGFPDKIFLSPPLPILTGLAEAVNERLFNPTYSALPPPPPLSPFNTETMKNWFYTFESYLNSAIVGYINHTINDGDFNGLDTIQMWTRETIYEHLGETEIIYKDCILAPLLWSKYLLQKYRVINLLRWTKEQGKSYVTVNPTGYDCGLIFFTSGTSISNAVDNLLNNGIGGYPGAGISQKDIQVYKDEKGVYYAQCGMHQTKYHFTVINPYDYNLTLYLYARNNMSPLEFTNEIRTYSSLYQPKIEAPRKWYMLETAEDFAGSEYLTDVYGNKDQKPYGMYPEEPQGIGTNYTSRIVTGANEFMLVVRYDGQNGFKFRGEDWDN